ncbi:hypothetical protein FHS61_000643 [Altererythrobacter atlanticus]|uniref:Uncharacterized protein n=1 Tax=Croceibacterium atlanticum TaxID=1267766 RepID=A0A0F7KVT5_9SPHN|nr:hypothetical protein [Croceibacterium atlanticum]AKH42870.1 hypothetical protein WYH_01834 [Croceibacterium atlanticum]MBB5731650.1 hypothetical protein [Croceibacterium atlanticum]
MLSLSVSIIWLLAMLGAAVHGRDSAIGMAGLIRAGAAFAIILPLALWLSPQPNWVAVLVGITAAWRLIAGRSAAAGPFRAGATAALAASLAAAAGISPYIAAALTVLALALALLLRSREPDPDGSPRELLLVVVALATPLVGLLADMLFGWQSAAMLNREAIEINAPSPPAWAVGITALALLAGLVKGLRTKQ